jgi:DNA-binding NtrC family response regulator
MANERILVIDGDVLLRLAVSDYLRDAGFVVIEAACADDAWTYLTAEGAVDLVFSEVSTTGAHDGVKLALSIETHFIALPVILTSGQDPGPAQAGWTFIAKPYAFERVAAAIRKALKLEEPRDGL